MGLSDTPIIGQPSRPKNYPWTELEEWIKKNAFLWCSGQNIGGQPAFPACNRWNDLTPNNNDLIQVTGVKQPTIELGVLNGFPGIHFNPAPVNEEDFLGVMGGLSMWPSGHGDREHFVLAQCDLGDSTRHGILGATGAGSGAGDMHIGRDGIGTDPATYKLRTTQTSASPTWAELHGFPGVDTPFIWNFRGEDWTLGADIESNLNGGATATTAGKATQWRDQIIAGRVDTSSNQFFLDGYLFEVIIFAKFIPADRRTQIVNYLNDKWNL